MKKVSVPQSNRKKALILVDMQAGFLRQWKESVVENLKVLIEQETYDLFVEVSFHAEKDSLWDRQTGWTFPYEPVVPEVQELLKGKNVVRVKKETRSSFKGDVDLQSKLKENEIEEVHVVGVDSSDCVFATVQEAFDLGFFAYVIEECTCASQGEEIHTKALDILRRLGLTNHVE